jgi:two-component sensor histidine kinase
MADRSDLIRQANDLKERAAHEADEELRNRLLRMADHYQHLADSQTWSDAHPATVASLGDVFTKGE